MFQKLKKKIKKWWYIRKVRNRVWKFLYRMNTERVKAYQEKRPLDMTVFGPDTLWEHEEAFPDTRGIRIYLKPFYLDTGFFSDPYSILILKEPPKGKKGLQKSFENAIFYKIGAILDYQSPTHLYEALDLKVTEWTDILQKEIVRSETERQTYLEGVITYFPSVNSVVAPKYTVPCEICRTDLEVTEADLELTNCSSCDTEYVLVVREEEKILIKVLDGAFVRPKRLEESTNANLSNDFSETPKS